MENLTESFIPQYLAWYVGSISRDMNIFLSIPNKYSKLPNLKENAIYLDLFEKKNQKIDAKKYMIQLLDIADANKITLYLEPIPRYKYIITKAKKNRLTKEYLENYYFNFGFKKFNEGWMERISK